MKKMTLMQHFAELRRRILWVALVFLVSFVAGCFFAPMVQQFLTIPLLSVWPEGALIYTGLTDGLMISFSLGAGFALLLTLPVALWHLWAFIAPALKLNERRFIWPILVMSPVLFLLGAGFAFWFLFPIVFKFFLELNQASPVPSVVLPVARDYLQFAIGMLKIFGVAFQLPLVLILLNRVGMLSVAQMRNMRRYAIVIIVVFAAVLTPPDVVSQIMLAIPLWLLFEISILFMRKD